MKHDESVGRLFVGWSVQSIILEDELDCKINKQGMYSQESNEANNNHAVGVTSPALYGNIKTIWQNYKVKRYKQFVSCL